MKKIVRSLSLVLVVLTLCLSLVSCGVITSGSYTYDGLHGGTTTYTFRLPGIVTKTYVSGSQETKTTYRYKIEENADGEMEISLTRRVDGQVKKWTYSFEQGEDYIEIDSKKFVKN